MAERVLETLRSLRFPGLVSGLMITVGVGACSGDRVPAADEANPAGTPESALQDVPVSPFAGLYEQGVEFSAFLEGAERRRDAWHDNYGRTVLSEESLARARALSGAWRLLVVAEDWCGDSANTIPYLAKLVEAVDGLEMRVINSTVGRALMDAHPTPDGRGATPTVLVLDEADHEVGCWVERPAVLQQWFLSNEERLVQEDLFARKYSWYDWDKGEQTVSDIVGVLEGAAKGDVVCGVGA